MAVGYSGSLVGLAEPGRFPAGGGRRARSGTLSDGSSWSHGPSWLPNCRMSLTRESETYYTLSSNTSWSGLDNWQPIDTSARVNGSVPVPATERRHTLTLNVQRDGARVLIWGNGTCTDTSGAVSVYFDVCIDWTKEILGSGQMAENYRLSRKVKPSQNWIAARGAEVSNGTGAFDFRVLSPPLKAGWHTFTLMGSHSSNVSTAAIGQANPRAGSDNDGWISFGVVEIPGSDRYGRYLTNLTQSTDLGCTVVVPGPNNPLTPGIAWQAYMPISGGALQENEGFFNTSSTTFVTVDSMSHGAGTGFSNNRFSQKLFLPRGGPVLILVGMTVTENNVGERALFDVRMDGVRLGDPTNGLTTHGTQVSSGTGAAHLEYITRWLNPGWHFFELMGRCASATVLNIGHAGASMGTNNDGWLRMHCIGLA